MHPILIAAAFVLNMGLENEVALGGMARPLAVAVGAASALTALGWLLLRNRWDGALAALAVVVLVIGAYPGFLAWRAVTQTLGSAVSGGIGAALLVAAVGAPAMLALRARHRNRPFPRPAAGVLNLFSLLLIGVVVLAQTGPDVVAQIGRPATLDTAQEDADASSSAPDIYVIMLDAYPRADVLHRRFAFDNSGFLRDLRARDFSVAEDSHSNYVFTQLTMASMMQMRHVDEIAALQPLVGHAGVHHARLRETINRGGAIGLLREAGYEIVALPSGYEHVALREASDHYLDHGQLTDLERSLLERTPILDLLSAVDPYFFANSQRDRIALAFDDLDALATSPRHRPRFVFAHLPAPHLPFVVDTNGGTVPLVSRHFDLFAPEAIGLTDKEFTAAYLNELSYLNRRIVQVVDHLLASPSPSPVVVIMSDHGWTFSGSKDQPGRFANLFATYTPEAAGLLDDATPVNVMSMVLNRYLSTDLPIAANRYFLSPPDSMQMMQISEIADPDHLEAIP